MARSPTLTYDRGTLLLHPPPRGQAWIPLVTWDDRVEKFRLPAHRYRALVECLQAERVEFIDQARAFTPLELIPSIEQQPTKRSPSRPGKRPIVKG